MKAKEMIAVLTAFENGEEIEMSSDGKTFMLSVRPTWNFNYVTYRVKQKTININGYEVPEPCREPLENGTTYYVYDLVRDELIYTSTWVSQCGDSMDKQRLKRGLIHLTKEAAVAHAEALLSFTQKED
jgi:hypothetical protein